MDSLDKKFVKILSFSALSLVFFILFTAMILFFLGVCICALHFVIANVLSMIFCSIIFKAPKKVFLAHVLNFIILYIFAIFYFSTKDFSSDVILYHLPVIKLLYTGWNPVDLNTVDAPSHLWSKYFAKGPWVIYSVIASFFKNIEIARIINGFLIYTSLLFSYIAFKNYIEKDKICCILLTFIAGFNIISFVQSLTFLVDGFLSSCLIIFISALFLYFKTKDIKYLFALSFSMCLAINAKLSVIAYIFIIGASAIFFIKKDFKYLITFFTSIFISLFMLGFNPYMANLIKHKNPFYPIGSNDIKIVEGFCPKTIENRFFITKFIISQFSEATADKNANVQFKIPFSITKNEASIAHCPQMNISGFGFLFSGVILLSILFIMLSYKKKGYKKFLILELILFLSVLINPECWWARFVPHFCLFPVILAVFLLYETEDKKYKIFAYILILAMFLNIFVTDILYLKKTSENQRIQNELTYNLKHYGGEIYVNSNEMNIEGIRIKLNDYGINFKEKEDMECKGLKLKYSTIPLCLVPIKNN